MRCVACRDVFCSGINVRLSIARSICTKLVRLNRHCASRCSITGQSGADVYRNSVHGRAVLPFLCGSGPACHGLCLTETHVYSSACLPSWPAWWDAPHSRPGLAFTLQLSSGRRDQHGVRGIPASLVIGLSTTDCTPPPDRANCPMKRRRGKNGFESAFPAVAKPADTRRPA